MCVSVWYKLFVSYCKLLFTQANDSERRPCRRFYAVYYSRFNFKPFNSPYSCADCTYTAKKWLLHLKTVRSILITQAITPYLMVGRYLTYYLFILRLYIGRYRISKQLFIYIYISWSVYKYKISNTLNITIKYIADAIHKILDSLPFRYI